MTPLSSAAQAIDFAVHGPGLGATRRDIAAQAQPEPVVLPDLDAEFRSWYVNRYGRPYFGGIALVECVEWTQFVLARWGTPTIKPVPVSERLPGAEDCDAEGRCWLTNVDVEPGWVLDNPEQCTNWTHWLPHWALPVPGAEVQS